tara:strand:+ start:417 stop:659 length:243 start_codon:yes stop_codon:yes gene_type:complete
MLLEKEHKIIHEMGPFERARTNIEKFAWNFMIVYTVSTIAKAYEHIEKGGDSLELTKITADATLKGVFQLVLEKNNNVWD